MLRESVQAHKRLPWEKKEEKNTELGHRKTRRVCQTVRDTKGRFVHRCWGKKGDDAWSALLSCLALTWRFFKSQYEAPFCHCWQAQSEPFRRRGGISSWFIHSGYALTTTVGSNYDTAQLEGITLCTETAVVRHNATCEGLAQHSVSLLLGGAEGQVQG